MARNKIGVAHDGSHNGIARNGEAKLSVHHSSQDARLDDVGIAPHFMKPAAKKQLPDTPVHAGMHERQVAGAGVGGVGHATAILDGGQVVGTSAAAQPLAHAYGSVLKVRGPAAISPGMKNRCGPIARSLNDATPTSIGQELLDQR
jgi:hypothetical protein